MSNLAKRVLTGVLAGALVIGMIYLSIAGLLLFCFIVTLLGVLELMKITNTKKGTTKFFSILLVVWAYIYLLNELLPYKDAILTRTQEAPYLGLSFLIFPLAGFFLLTEKENKHPLFSFALIPLSFIYIVVPFGMFYQMSDLVRNADHVPYYKPMFPLGILFLIWATDIFAYFGGKYLGKHKLWERISPKKTWEGSIIGAVACIATGFILQVLCPIFHWDWRIAACIVAVTSQVGDLAESMFKRSLHLKDSGGILPGHGGILDRFDGFLFSLPVLWFYWMCVV